MISRRIFVGLGLTVLASPKSVFAEEGGQTHTEARMQLAEAGGARPRVALSLLASSGTIDYRILDTLMTEQIAATIFVTGQWIDRNRSVFDNLLTFPDLIEIQNHGMDHRPALLSSEPLYGMTPLGTEEAIREDIVAGADAIAAAGGPQPRWFRGIASLYSFNSLALIRSMGFDVAGFTINADNGASQSASTVEERVLGAHDGDIISAQINKPESASGEGLARGIAGLKQRGYDFVMLSNTETVQSV